MFDRLRHKFHSVQENLTASIRGLSSAEPQNRSQIPRFSDDVNLNAGTEILENYQTCWAELHEAAQENASKAQEVDQLIGKLHKRLQKQSRDIGQTGTILTRLPEVIYSVTELTERIASLEALFDSVENALIQFEDLVEIRELQDRQLDHRFQLALYKEKKLSMLQSFRINMTEKHAEKLKRHELKQLKLMKERQEAFEDQFKHDMEVYKETSTIPKIDTSSDKDDGKLEDIKLEPEDHKVLDEFLRDSTPESS
ncbi:UNVERIFIED_CONTAM: hypothetical protein PYX00_004395 [Menopon gallinae]|uniref:Dysbindin n=1 Tax=Menopon gallinae TaxID=328185 RepID=A0AAW2I5G5_9NEOP